MAEYKQFSALLEKANLNIRNLDMQRSFNSIGSNIFFEFGDLVEFSHKNGIEKRREWVLWIGNTSWRVLEREKYVVGSSDNRDLIQKVIQDLLSKRLEQINVISPYLDMEFVFKDRYKIITFFNWCVEEQWVLFFPDATDIAIDASTSEAIQAIRESSAEIRFKEKYQKLNCDLPDLRIKTLNYDVEKHLLLSGDRCFLLDCGSCVWRLEKDKQYQIGAIDFRFRVEDNKKKESEDKLSDLIKKKVEQVDIDQTGMDVRIHLEEGYVLEIFKQTLNSDWKMIYEEEILLSSSGYGKWKSK